MFWRVSETNRFSQYDLSRSFLYAHFSLTNFLRGISAMPQFFPVTFLQCEFIQCNIYSMRIYSMLTSSTDIYSTQHFVNATLLLQCRVILYERQSATSFSNCFFSSLIAICRIVNLTEYAICWESADSN